MKNPPRFGGILIFLILTALCIPALAAKDDIFFSLESGFYAQPQQLEITAETKDAVIYYTLDGSAPGENSLRYEGPILLSDTTKKHTKVISSMKSISFSSFLSITSSATTMTTVVMG